MVVWRLRSPLTFGCCNSFRQHCRHRRLAFPLVFTFFYSSSLHCSHIRSIYMYQFTLAIKLVPRSRHFAPTLNFCERNTTSQWPQPFQLANMSTVGQVFLCTRFRASALPNGHRHTDTHTPWHAPCFGETKENFSYKKMWRWLIDKKCTSTLPGWQRRQLNWTPSLARGFMSIPSHVFFSVGWVRFIVAQFTQLVSHEIDIFRWNDAGKCVRLDLVAVWPMAGIKVCRAPRCLSSHCCRTWVVFVVQRTENSNLYFSMPINWYRTLRKRLRNLLDKPTYCQKTLAQYLINCQLRQNVGHGKTNGHRLDASSKYLRNSQRFRRRLCARMDEAETHKVLQNRQRP